MFDLERAFTETYRSHLDKDPAVREAECLRVLMPSLFDGIQDGDRFAGRIHYRLVGFGLEEASGGPGYYCWGTRLLRQAQDAPPELRTELEQMVSFWDQEATIAGRLLAKLSPEHRRQTENKIAHMGGRLAGTVLDFDKLVRLGLPGLRAEIRQATAANGGKPLHEAMLSALDLLGSVAKSYADQADRLGTEDGRRIAGSCRWVADNPPSSLHQALQLFWLYALISGTVNYGRMDVAFGVFLVRDLESGTTTEDQALKDLQSLWQMMADRKIIFNGRVYVGGKGRRNEAASDRFALLAMEATRTVIEVEPQLTLRFCEGQNPALMEKALTVIGEGRTYPMLFNDDVNVSAVMHGFRVSEDAAERYLPYGCGEYALEGISFGSPNCSLNLLKALEATLHQGRDAQTGETIGLNLGSLDSFADFDDLWSAYQVQVEHFVVQLADRHRIEYQTEAESAAFLFPSMLYDDCIARGRSLVDGGVRYRGGLIETFGMVNSGDSLAAIQKLVYQEKACSLAELVDAMDANFVGHETIEKACRTAPKYGNDDDRVDGWVCAVSDHVASTTHSQADRIGFDYFLVVNINNHANVGLGKQTAASADGRKDCAPLANGNTPTAGNDVSGVTAFLNSIAKVDPKWHAGYTHNMKFGRRMFADERPKLEALLDTYFASGGTQAMITVLGRGDLEAALREPDKHRNLIVRVGGFSARFVELPSEVQADLLARTLY